MPEITKFLEEQIYRTGGFEGYTPLGSKYMDIHRSPAVERWDISGNRKGKTAEFIVEDCWDATGAGPKYYHEARPPKLPNHGRIVATNFNDGVMKVILPELRKWIPKKFLLGGSWEESYDARHRILRLKHSKNWREASPDPETLSTVDLMSFDQDPQAFAGAARDWVHQDEHGPRIIYQENKIRLISTKGHFRSSLTPIDESGQPMMSWEYDYIYEDWEKNKDDPEFRKRLEVFRGSTFDNPLNSPEAIEMLTHGMDEETKQVRLFGDFLIMAGLIYKEFRDKLYVPVKTEKEFYERSGHLVEPFTIPAHWPRFFGMDPHPRTPTFSLWVAVAPDGTRYYYDEFWPSVEGTLVKAYFDILKIKEKDSGSFGKIRYRLIDPSAKEPDPILGTTVKEEYDKLFRDYDGIVTREANKNVSAGIQQVHKSLIPELRTDPKYGKIWKPNAFIFKNMIETRHQYRHYIWDEFSRRQEAHDPKQKPRKKRDHGMDLTRYLEMSGLAWEAPKVFTNWRGNPYMNRV